MSSSPPQVPRAERLMAGLRWLLVAGVAVVAVWAWLPRLLPQAPSQARPAEQQKFVCPMHPQIVQDGAGTCPICQMDLVPFDRNAATDNAMTDEAMSDDSPAGTQPLRLALDRVQAIGVRTAVAEAASLTPTAEVVGQVLAAEQGRSEVHVRAPAFIEKVLVAETGVSVRRGEALAQVYSPEIVAMQGEVLAAGQWSDPSARSAVRQRLALYGLSESEMDALFREGKPRRLLTLRAPMDGVLLTRDAVPGGYAEPERALFTLQDLNALWLELQVPVRHAAQLQPGLEVQARTADGVPLRATLQRLLPEVDAERRTQRARCVLQAPPAGLAPGTWVSVALPVGKAREAVLVPRDAVIDTGKERYVFVVADGWYLPTRVELGELAGERVEVREGLAAGDVVVASGAFLIDAESRVQAQVKALSQGATPTGGQP